MNVEKEELGKDIFGDVVIPFFVVAGMFFLAYWYSKPFTWDYLMFRQLFTAIFFNFFLQKGLTYGLNKGKKRSFLYVILWEIAAPLLGISLVFLALIIEYKLYNIDFLFINYQFAIIALVMLVLLQYFVRIGIKFIKGSFYQS